MIDEQQEAYYDNLVRDLKETLAIGDYEEVLFTFLEHFKDEPNILKFIRFAYNETVENIYG